MFVPFFAKMSVATVAYSTTGVVLLVLVSVGEYFVPVERLLATNWVCEENCFNNLGVKIWLNLNTNVDGYSVPAS